MPTDARPIRQYHSLFASLQSCIFMGAL